MVIMGIDVGYGDVKAVSNGQTIKFPTAVAQVKSSDYSETDLFKDTVYSFKGKEYFVGRDALFSDNCYSTRTDEFLFKFAPLLVYAVFEKLGKADAVGIGLPLAMFLDRDMRKRFEESLRTFEVNGKRIDLDVYVYAQGQGIFVDYVFNGGENEKETVLILDIGFNTLDVLCVVKGRPTREGSTTFDGYGVARMVQKLVDYIARKYRVSLSEQEGKEILRSGYLKIYGKKIDLGLVIEEIAEDYTDWLLEVVKSQWAGFLRRADRIVLAGGGAYYLQNVIRTKYETDGFIFIPDSPEFSNARGFERLCALDLEASVKAEK